MRRISTDFIGLKLLAVFSVMSLLLVSAAAVQNSTSKKTRDPKGWGGNHVGKPIPEYVQGDECLFCHRNDIGPTWEKNSHGLTVRERESAPELSARLKSDAALENFAPEVGLFMGSRHRVRFLRRDGYGKFALLNVQAVLDKNQKIEKWVELEKPIWDKDKYADRCAGCHSTAVDSATKTFSAFGLDCYTCHGDVNLEHSKDTSLVLLSKKRRNDVKVITSLCAQCHLREGKAKSTGLPYPNNFVAGDNLFQDFEADFARAVEPGLNAGDRHIWRNVRDVVINGDESISCLNCHQVHANSSFKHRRVLRAPICSECHQGAGFKEIKRYVVHSGLCEY
jgi:hypothetical protein